MEIGHLPELESGFVSLLLLLEWAPPSAREDSLCGRPAEAAIADMPCSNLVVLLAALPCASPQGAPPESTTRVVFLESPAVDLYFAVRAAAAAPDPPATLAPALEAARTLDREL